MNKPYVAGKIREYLVILEQSLGRKLTPEDVINNLRGVYANLQNDDSSPLGNIPYQEFETAAVVAYQQKLFGN